MTDTQTLLTTAQAAAHLHVQPQTMRKWRLTGRGPRFHRLGPYPNGRVRYDMRDVRAWLGSRARRSTSEESCEQ